MKTVLQNAPLSPNGTAAVNYARKNLHVFPCRPGRKEPIPQSGYKAATTNLDQIRAWWTAYPDANIALSLEASGLVALDADIYKEDCQFDEWIKTKEIPHTFKHADCARSTINDAARNGFGKRNSAARKPRTGDHSYQPQSL